MIYACNRASWTVDPYGLLSTLCGSNVLERINLLNHLGIALFLIHLLWAWNLFEMSYLSRVLNGVTFIDIRLMLWPTQKNKQWNAANQYALNKLETGSGVRGKIFDFSKISDSDSLILSEWNLAVNNFVATNTQWKSWYTTRIICINKSFIRNCAISTGIANLGVWYKNIQLDFRSRTKKSDSDS